MNDMNKIQFSPNDEDSWSSWSLEIDEFLQSYNLTTSNFTLDMLGPCGISPYGYNESRPCIYLKLNKIYGVENTPCNLTEIENQDSSQAVENSCSEMPENLQKVAKKANDSNQVWIECRGKTSNDTKLEYFPSSQGFHGRHYPFLRQKGLSRIILL